MSLRTFYLMLALFFFTFTYFGISQAVPYVSQTPIGVSSDKFHPLVNNSYSSRTIAQQEEPATPTPTPIPIPPQLEISQTRALIWLAVLLVILFLLGIWTGLRRTSS